MVMVMVMVMVMMMVMVMVEIEPHQLTPQQNSPEDSDDNEATTIERFLTRNKKQILSIVFVFIHDRKPMKYFWKLSECGITKVEEKRKVSSENFV